MRKVTGKKKDVENGDGEEAENYESEDEANGVEEGDPLATEDNDEDAGEENEDEAEEEEDDDQPLKPNGKKGGKKAAKKPAKKAAAKGKKGAKGKAAKANKKKVEEDEDDEEQEYEVEDIVAHKFVKGVLMYQIRWKGYSEDDDTWEAKDSLNCPDIIKRYESENEIQPPLAKRGRPLKGSTAIVQPKKKPRTEVSDEEDEGKEYEVARILDVTVKKDGSREFLVHWKGWSSRFDSWEPEANLNCEDLIAKFDKNLSKAKDSTLKELRIAPKTTKHFMARNAHSGSRHSKRGAAKERVTYFEQD